MRVYFVLIAEMYNEYNIVKQKKNSTISLRCHLRFFFATKYAHNRLPLQIPCRDFVPGRWTHWGLQSVPRPRYPDIRPC